MLFITNEQNKEFKKRLTELVFYFSGLKELYYTLKYRFKPEEDFQDFSFKILVGLEVDKFQYQLIELAENENLSGENIYAK